MLATQPLLVPGAETATQPTQAPGAGPEVLPAGVETTLHNQSPPIGQNSEVARESDSEAELDGEPASPASVHCQGDLPDTATDQDLSEDANYRETIRGVRNFMNLHHIPDYSEGGLHTPLPVQTPLDKVTDCNKQLPHPTKQSFLLEALYQLINKNAVEPVDNPNSLGFYNWLFLVPKPNNRWRPILDLSTLNTFLNTGSFKMETPETIRTSLQVGEWVTSIDFKDAYFHIPIHSQSRKYMRFHLQGRSYQFKALPFGLSTAPMEFTVVAKEVKLVALQKGIRIHQYLDDWLVRASTHDTCLQHTQTLGFFFVVFFFVFFPLRPFLSFLTCYDFIYIYICLICFFKASLQKNIKCSTINITLTNLHHIIGGERERERGHEKAYI